jgi:hypothetical protein
MVGRNPGNSFVFMEFEEGGGVVEVAALALDAAGLDVAEHVEALSELAGDAMALDTELSQEVMGIDDVEGNFLGAFSSGRDWGGDAREHVGFEERDAVERQEVSASSWVSLVSKGVAGWYSSKKRRSGRGARR